MIIFYIAAFVAGFTALPVEQNETTSRDTLAIEEMIQTNIMESQIAGEPLELCFGIHEAEECKTNFIGEHGAFEIDRGVKSLENYKFELKTHPCIYKSPVMGGETYGSFGGRKDIIGPYIYNIGKRTFSNQEPVARDPGFWAQLMEAHDKYEQSFYPTTPGMVECLAAMFIDSRNNGWNIANVHCETGKLWCYLEREDILGMPQVGSTNEPVLCFTGRRMSAPDPKTITDKMVVMYKPLRDEEPAMDELIPYSIAVACSMHPGCILAETGTVFPWNCECDHSNHVRNLRVVPSINTPPVTEIRECYNENQFDIGMGMNGIMEMVSMDDSKMKHTEVKYCGNPEANPQIIEDMREYTMATGIKSPYLEIVAPEVPGPTTPAPSRKKRATCWGFLFFVKCPQNDVTQVNKALEDLAYQTNANTMRFNRNFAEIERYQEEQAAYVDERFAEFGKTVGVINSVNMANFMNLLRQITSLQKVQEDSIRQVLINEQNIRIIEDMLGQFGLTIRGLMPDFYVEMPGGCYKIDRYDWESDLKYMSAEISWANRTRAARPVLQDGKYITPIELFGTEGDVWRSVVIAIFCIFALIGIAGIITYCVMKKRNSKMNY